MNLLESLIQKRDILNELIEEEQKKKVEENPHGLPWEYSPEKEGIVDCDDGILNFHNPKTRNFIVKACNSYPSRKNLLEALQWAVDIFDSEVRKNSDGSARFPNCIANLKEVIAEARKHQ